MKFLEKERRPAKKQTQTEENYRRKAKMIETKRIEGGNTDRGNHRKRENREN